MRLTAASPRRPVPPGSRLHALLAIGALTVAVAAPAAAQHDSTPPPPLPRPVLRAVRASGPIVIDGRLDEPAWRAAPQADGFRQVEPYQGAPAAYPTTVRVLFDERFVYLAFVARDTLVGGRLRVPEMRRDFNSGVTDFLGVVLDPFDDDRNAVMFETTPYEALQDMQGVDGRRINEDWDAVWRARTSRSDSGWVAEFAIPWNSLRYPREARPWGVNFYRDARVANELSAWAPWPRNLNRSRMEFAGSLEGLEPPPPRTNLRLRPYLLGQSARAGGTGPALGRGTARVGGEVIWAPTAGSVLDLTVDTDFAQADVDRQVVNLTRFSVFFPERRQFFLENADVFSVGGETGDFVLQPFFSRRIGLDADAAPVPITAGARYVQRDARQVAAALLVRQEGQGGAGPSTFGVARFSRNVGRAGRLGGLVTTRLDEAGSATGGGRSAIVALDGFTRVTDELEAGTMASVLVRDGGREGVGVTAFVRRQTQTLGSTLQAALVSRDYDPATGFVSRTDVVALNGEIEGDVRPTWRPVWLRTIRPGVAAQAYLTPGTTTPQEGSATAYVDVFDQGGARVGVFAEASLQRPAAPITFLPGVTIAPGDYRFGRWGGSARTDPSSPLAVEGSLATGGFFDGSQDNVELGARWTPIPYVSVAARYSGNRLRGVGPADAEATTHLLQPEVRLAWNARTLLNLFWQYNSVTGSGALNARFSWEFQPLSYLFVVYNDLRGLGATSALPPASERQQLVVKVTYLHQW